LTLLPYFTVVDLGSEHTTVNTGQSTKPIKLSLLNSLQMDQL